MKRRTFATLSGISLIVSLVLAAPASANASDKPESATSTVSAPASWTDFKTGTVKHGIAVTKTTTKKFHLTPRSIAGKSAAINAGCSWLPQEYTTAYYFAGILDHVSVLYSNPLDCDPGLADFIFNNIKMIWHGTIDYSSQVTDNCTQGPCTHTNPSGAYLCNLQFLCAGTYEAEADFTITLLPGYYWPTPPPPYCTIGSNGQALGCNAFTGQVDIPGTN